MDKKYIKLFTFTFLNCVLNYQIVEDKKDKNK